jgi:hypothetical protein
MKPYKTSKSLQKIADKGTKKFVNDVYFNPKRREEIRKMAVKGQADFLEIIERPLGANPHYDDMFGKAWADTFLNHMTNIVDLVDNIVPKRLEEIKITNGKYKSYIESKGRELVFDVAYDKGIPKKHLHAHMIISSGPPVRGKRTKAKLIRVKFNPKGYTQVDSGLFFQNLKSFQKVEQIFKGKKKTLKFFLTQRGKIKDDYWLKVTG